METPVNFKFLNDYSYSDLELLAKAIKEEKEKRDRVLFEELCKKAADALNELRRNFPCVSYSALTHRCDCCDAMVDVDIFNLTDSFEANRFVRN